MSTKLRVLIIVVIVATGLSGAVAVGQAQESTDSSVIGPYTEIQLPLEDLPALNENLAFHPVIDQYESGATLQIMYVLEDPRDVPLARYAYYNEDLGVIAPNDLPISYVDNPEYKERMEEIVSINPKTINVYVRVMAPSNQSVPDPLFEDLKQRVNEDGSYIHPNNPNRPAILVYYPGPNSHPLSCAAPEYIDGPEPYQLPPGINGGDAVGSDGLYDPGAYAPPRPWYDNQDPLLEPGEVREGWVSCLAPDMPIENILIEAIYRYTPEPQPTPTPGPSPTPYDDSDCAIVDSFNDPVCLTGVCCKLSANATLEAMIDATSTAWASEDDGEVNWEVYESSMEVGWAPAWSYTRTSTIPDEGIRLEDVGMVFINEEGNQKSASGAAFIKSANVVQAERHQFNDFLFTAEVSVEPDGLSEEDLRGFVLYRIDVDVEIYEQANSTTAIFGIKEVQNTLNSPYERFLGANFNYLSLGGALQLDRGKQSFAHLFMHKPDSPFTGYVFGNLEAYYDEPPALYEKVWNGPIPTTLWFNIDNSAPPSGTIDSPKVRDLTRYAAKGINIYNTSFLSSTTMCDAVECLDVQDPEDDDHEVRTVPLMCPGEWANNFIIDRLGIEDIDYIGSPERLISNFAPDLFSYVRFINEQPRAWIHSGRIMGGLSPWWSTKDYYNSGKMVDLNSGSYITGITYDATIGILPYYSKISKAYYVPVGDYNQGAGWFSDIASNKLLVFGIVDDKRYNEENTGFLFLEEGPIWEYTCSRSIVNGINEIDSYSPPLNGSSFEIYERYHQMKFMLPGFAYPVSEPRINGEVLPLGSEGPIINEQVLKPVEVKTIPGKANEPIYYVHSEDAFYPARKNESDNNLIYLRNADAQLIPPDSSLILVRLEKVSPAGQLDCRTSPDKIQISYPGYYPITTSPEILLEFNTGVLAWVCSDNNFNESWLVFKFPALNVDPSQLTFSIMGEENWVFWSLSDN